MKKLLFILGLISVRLFAQDPELSNLRSGHDVIWGAGDGSDKGSAYYEEYLYFDKTQDDHKIVYLRSTTPIQILKNARNRASTSGATNFATFGANGPDGLPDTGDEGVTRYRWDRDRQMKSKWVQIWSSDAAKLLPAYTGPITMATCQYGLGDTAVIAGSVGSNGGSPSDYTNTYYRGTIDDFGDEWHTLAYGDDSSAIQAALGISETTVDRKDRADDGKTVLIVVDPKTPCFTARATGTGQFFTTPPKAYFTPRVVPQTTYIAPGSSGAVTIELRDIFGNNIYYRINGGSFTNSGASTVTLTDSQFSDGSNTLEYYYAGNAAHTKTRTVVKNPDYPSAGESHGYLWFQSPDFYAKAVTRATTPGTVPYSRMQLWRTTSDNNGSGHDSWFANRGLGKRQNAGTTDGGILRDILVAKINGFNYTKSGEPMSYGQAAIGRMLDGVLQMDQIGAELDMNNDAIPNREMHYRGYYNAEPFMAIALAYDVVAADFKASQVTGGMTPIQDLFIRDGLARYAYINGMLRAQFGVGNVINSPGMWGGATMTVAGIIAMAMPEYTSEVYGTSGVGVANTTYYNCPFQDEKWTWAQVLLEARTHTGYPNIVWGTGWDDNGATNSILFPEGKVVGGVTYGSGNWIDKKAYLSLSQMGRIVMTYSNIVRSRFPAYEKSRITDLYNRGSSGTLYCLKDPAPYGPGYQGWFYLMNENWPTQANAQLAGILAKPSSDSGSDDKQMDSYSIVYFDADYSTGADVTAPTLTTASIANSILTVTYSEATTGSDGFTLSLSGGAATVSLLSGTNTATRTYTISRTVGNETGTLDYTPGTVIDLSGNALASFSGRTISITGAGDSTLPTIAITAPSGNVAVTSPNYTAFAGTAADNVGVNAITWSNSTGGTGTATGTTSWTIPTITLQPGDNIISVQSRDAAGNLSIAATRTITYNPVIVGTPQTHTNPRNRHLLGW